jgi:hypothetical protein
MAGQIDAPRKTRLNDYPALNKACIRQALLRNARTGFSTRVVQDLFKNETVKNLLAGLFISFYFISFTG